MREEPLEVKSKKKKKKKIARTVFTQYLTLSEPYSPSSLPARQALRKVLKLMIRYIPSDLLPMVVLNNP